MVAGRFWIDQRRPIPLKEGFSIVGLGGLGPAELCGLKIALAVSLAERGGQ